MPTVTPVERAVDRLLLLYSISRAFEHVKNLGDTKLQKFTFLSEWEMIDKRERGFTYFYLKYAKGPYSFELNNDIETLIKANIVRKRGWNISLTKIGNSIIDDFYILLQKNRYPVTVINKTISKYGNFSLQELLDEVYSLPHPYVKGYTIRSATIKMPLLYKLPDEKVTIPFDIDEKQVEDLLLCLGTDGLKHWQAIKQDMYDTDYLTYKEVFGTARF